MAVALHTCCPHLLRSSLFCCCCFLFLFLFLFFVCLSHKLLQTIKRTNPDYSETIVKEQLEETLDFGSQRGFRTENL